MTITDREWRHVLRNGATVAHAFPLSDAGTPYGPGGLSMCGGSRLRSVHPDLAARPLKRLCARCADQLAHRGSTEVPWEPEWDADLQVQWQRPLSWKEQRDVDVAHHLRVIDELTAGLSGEEYRDVRDEYEQNIEDTSVRLELAMEPINRLYERNQIERRERLTPAQLALIAVRARVEQRITRLTVDELESWLDMD